MIQDLGASQGDRALASEATTCLQPPAFDPSRTAWAVAALFSDGRGNWRISLGMGESELEAMGQCMDLMEPGDELHGRLTGNIAIAIEAQRAETGTGSVHESAGQRHRQDTATPTKAAEEK